MEFMIYALERPVHFLNEHWSKLYQEYCLRSAQLKNVLCAKNTLQRQALLGLERGGA